MDVVAEAKALLSKHKGTLYGLYSDSLGKELAGNSMNRTAVVNEVFTQIIEQGYSNQEIIDVSRAFLDALSPANLSQIAKTTSGSILLVRVKSFLNCDSEKFKSAARCMKIDMVFGQATGSVKPKVIPTPNDTDQAKKLNKAEIDYYKDLAKKKGEKFNEEIVWDLPTSGTGFIVYNQDDLKNAKNDIYGYDQIGTKEAIDNVMRIAREWSFKSDQKLQIGDLSRPGGIVTPDHRGHKTGKIVDIRPLRNPKAIDERALYYTDKQRYSVDMTKEFIRFVRGSNLATLIRFNDSDIANDQEFRGFVLKDGKGTVHDNHLHIEFQ
jgi:hypothetical protein